MGASFWRGSFLHNVMVTRGCKSMLFIWKIFQYFVLTLVVHLAFSYSAIACLKTLGVCCRKVLQLLYHTLLASISSQNWAKAHDYSFLLVLNRWWVINFPVQPSDTLASCPFSFSKSLLTCNTRKFFQTLPLALVVTFDCATPSQEFAIKWLHDIVKPEHVSLISWNRNTTKKDCSGTIISPGECGMGPVATGDSAAYIFNNLLFCAVLGFLVYKPGCTQHWPWNIPKVRETCPNFS